MTRLISPALHDAVLAAITGALESPHLSEILMAIVCVTGMTALAAVCLAALKR